MRDLITTVTKRGALVFTSLVLVFSTVLPVATAQSAGAATPEYRLVAQPTTLTVETGTEVKSFYAFAEYRVQNCFLWWCEWSGWNDLPAWQNSPVNATVSGGAQVSSNGSVWGSSAVAANPLLDPKVDGTFSVKSDLVGTSTVNLTSTVRTVLGGLQNLTATVAVTAQDTTAPNVPVLTASTGSMPLLNGGYTNSYNITASWITPAGDPVKYDYKYWNNIASSAHNGEANAWVNPGLTSTQYAGVFNQGEGTHYMQVRAIDASGNPSAWSNTFVITYDVTLPVVTIKTENGVNDGSQGKDNTFSRISFKLNDPNGALQEVVLNGSVYPRENVWNDLNWVNINKTDFVEGSNTIYAVDRAGNKSEVVTFTYDKTKPTVTVKDNYVGSLNDKIFSNVSFALYDAYKVDKYDINGFVSDFTDNKWSDANYQNIKSKLNQGLNTFTLYDIAGNSTVYEFTYDSVAPTATLTYSNNNGNALTKNDVTATLTASENVKDIAGWSRQGTSNVFTKVFTANGAFNVTIADTAGNSATKAGEVKRIDRNAPTVSGVTNSATVNTPVNLSIFDPKYQGYDGYSETTGLKINGLTVPTTPAAGKTYLTTISADGYYEVVATDKAGNVAELSFTIDTVAPTVTVQDITAIIVGDTANVAGTVNDLAVGTVEIFVEGNSVGTASVVAGVFDFDLTNLTVGTHQVTVNAVDVAGNTGTSVTKTVVVNATPVITPATISAGPATLVASPAQPAANIVVTDNNTPVVDDAEVLGESTQNNAGDESKEVLAATTSPEVKGASDFALLGLAWYWWLLILAAVGVAAWWVIAAIRRQGQEA
jgi:hypothetical protein